MQKRKFDELISHFNRKVSDMGIDQKYKMELLGMISAIGFAHEKELVTDLAEVGTDCISRQAAVDALRDYLLEKRCPDDGTLTCRLIENEVISKLPSAQPEIIRCKDCKYWVHGYITDNDDFIPPKCGKWQQMVGHSSDDYCSLAERREVTT